MSEQQALLVKVLAFGLIIAAACVWGIARVGLQPIRPPATGVNHGPVLNATAPLTWVFTQDAAPGCSFLTKTSDGVGARVVVDFDCVRKEWPDASIFVTDQGVTVMLDDVMALCGPGISLRCAVR